MRIAAGHLADTQDFSESAVSKLPDDLWQPARTDNRGAGTREHFHRLASAVIYLVEILELTVKVVDANGVNSGDTHELGHIHSARCIWVRHFEDGHETPIAKFRSSILRVREMNRCGERHLPNHGGTRTNPKDNVIGGRTPTGIILGLERGPQRVGGSKVRQLRARGDCCRRGRRRRVVGERRVKRIAIPVGGPWREPCRLTGCARF